LNLPGPYPDISREVSRFEDYKFHQSSFLCPILLYVIIRRGENYGFYGNVRRDDSSYFINSSYSVVDNFYHNRDNS